MNPLFSFVTRELRAQRNATLGWLVPLSLLMIMYGSLQPQVAGDNGLLAAKLSVLPDSVKQAFSLSATDFSRPVSYLSTNFIMVTLGVSLFAGLLGANVVAREDAQRTSESLLTLPVSRWQILLGKLLAGVLVLSGFHLILGLASYGALARVATQPVEGSLVFAMFGGALLLALTFFAAGFLMGAVVRQARAAPNLSLGLVLGTYFLGVVSKVSPKAEALGHLSPYRLVEPAEIVAGGGLEAQAWALLAVTGLLLTAAVLWYERRDVHA